MGNMFYNYQNISDSYIPNNLINAFPSHTKDSKLVSKEMSKPFEEYNTKGELTGYFWRYGETLNLEFNLDGEIIVENNAIIFKLSPQAPNINTQGTIGQRAYNIIDLISWTCLGKNGPDYIWQQDKEFTYPPVGNSIYLSAEDYLKDKQVEVALYNFRMEPICKKVYAGSPNIIFAIDRELSQQLVKGIYYCTVQVFNNSVCYTVFDSNDCNLLVK
jgi:hypothetical protein